VEGRRGVVKGEEEGNVEGKERRDRGKYALKKEKGEDLNHLNFKIKKKKSKTSSYLYHGTF